MGLVQDQLRERLIVDCLLYITEKEEAKGA